MTVNEDLPPSSGAPLVVCGVCARTLDYNGRQRRYVHGLQDSQNEDHPPVPVRASEMQDLNARCDFCNHDVAMQDIWTVPASDFQLPPPAETQVSAGDWAACAECVRLVQQDRWTQLVKRVRDTTPSAKKRLVDAEGRRWLTALYRKLAVHITGEPYKGPTHRVRG